MSSCIKKLIERKDKMRRDVWSQIDKNVDETFDQSAKRITQHWRKRKGKSYRKRPIVVEAEQWFPGSEIDGVVANWDNDPRTKDKRSVKTLEGWLDVSPGDWIITGIQGEKYPCKPGIFRATYDLVE